MNIFGQKRKSESEPCRDNDFVCDEKVSARAVIEAQKWSEYYTKFCCQLFSDLPSLNVLHVYYTLTKKITGQMPLPCVECRVLCLRVKDGNSLLVLFFPCRCFAFSNCSIVGQGKIVSYILTFYFIRTTLLLLKTKSNTELKCWELLLLFGSKNLFMLGGKKEVLWLCKSRARTPQLSTRTIDSSCCSAWL